MHSLWFTFFLPFLHATMTATEPRITTAPTPVITTNIRVSSLPSPSLAATVGVVWVMAVAVVAVAVAAKQA